MDQREVQEPPELLVSPVLRDQREQLVVVVLQAQPVQPELQVFQDLRDQQELQV